MRAARAEPRRALRQIRGVIGAHGFSHAVHARLNTIRAAPLFLEDFAQFQRNIIRVQRIMAWEKLGPIGPFARAINPPPSTVIENGFLDLHLDQFALFFNADDQIQPLGPIMQPAHIHGPCLANLISGDAKPCGLIACNPQQFQRMYKIKPVLARRHKADLCPCFAQNALINAIGMGKRLGREALIRQETFFLWNPMIAKADIQPTLRHLEILRSCE